MSNIRSYGGNFMEVSSQEARHGSHKTVKAPRVRAQISMPEYPDSVRGLMDNQRENIASVEKAKNKKNNRLS